MVRVLDNDHFDIPSSGRLVSIGFRTRDLFVAYDKLSRVSDHFSLHWDEGALAFSEEDGHATHSIFWRPHEFSERFSLNLDYLNRMSRATLDPLTLATLVSIAQRKKAVYVNLRRNRITVKYPGAASVRTRTMRADVTLGTRPKGFLLRHKDLLGSLLLEEIPREACLLADSKFAILSWETRGIEWFVCIGGAQSVILSRE
jgi:hypothetical protein